MLTAIEITARNYRFEYLARMAGLYTPPPRPPARRPERLRRGVRAKAGLPPALACQWLDDDGSFCNAPSVFRRSWCAEEDTLSVTPCNASDARSRSLACTGVTRLPLFSPPDINGR